MNRRLTLASAGLLVLAGCAGNHEPIEDSPTARLNAPMHGTGNEPTEMQGTFVYMTDNALLADMTVSDRHFMPHRSRLNTLGIERLHRLAALMDAYGGTVRFNTDLDDRELLDKRAETITQFLADAGIDTTREIVVRDIPGGVGMSALEAILIRAEVGTFNPDAKAVTQPQLDTP